MISTDGLSQGLRLHHRTLLAPEALLPGSVPGTPRDLSDPSL